MQHVLGPPPAPSCGDCGYQVEPRKLDPAVLALMLCRDGADTLASRMRPVPDEYIHGGFVECACGVGNARRRMFECAGGCGRWLFSDEAGVWAARLDA